MSLTRDYSGRNDSHCWDRDMSSLTDCVPCFTKLTDELKLTIKDISRIVDLSESRIVTLLREEREYLKSDDIDEDKFTFLRPKTINEMIRVLDIVFNENQLNKTAEKSYSGYPYSYSNKLEVGTKGCFIFYRQTDARFVKQEHIPSSLFKRKLLINNLVFLLTNKNDVSRELVEIFLYNVVEFKEEIINMQSIISRLR